MRIASVALVCALAAPALASPAPTVPSPNDGCGRFNPDPHKRKELELAWLPIAERCYAETEDPEVRDVHDQDPDQLVAEPLGRFVLLGKTVTSGTTAKEWKLEDHAETVGATLVIYWVQKDSGKAAVDESQRTATMSAAPGGGVTLSTSRGGSDWHLASKGMKVTTGRVHAVFLRDCGVAPCGEGEPRPELGTLRACELERCAKPQPIRQRGYLKMSKVPMPVTESPELRRIDPAEINAFAAAHPDIKVLGKSVVPYAADDPEAIAAQARKVGATMVLWWVVDAHDEHAVYLRDCMVAACAAP